MLFVERVIRTIKEGILRRLEQGVGRRGQWHLLLPDIIAQINNRVHTATGVTPNEAYSNPDKAEQAWNSMQSRAKDTAEPPRAMVQAGDRVRIRLKPHKPRASYRVSELKWSEKVYRVLGMEHGSLGPRYRLEGWPEPMVRRDIRKISANENVRARGLEVQSRQRRRQCRCWRCGWGEGCRKKARLLRCIPAPPRSEDALTTRKLSVLPCFVY